MFVERERHAGHGSQEDVRPYAACPILPTVRREERGVKMTRGTKRSSEYSPLWAQIEDQIAPLFDYWLDVIFSEGIAPRPWPGHAPQEDGGTRAPVRTRAAFHGGDELASYGQLASRTLRRESDR